MHFRKRVMRQSYLQKHFQYRNEAQSHTKQHTSNQCNVFNWMMILLTEANKFLSYLQIWNIILFALEMNGLLIGCSWPAHELLIIFARHLIYRGQKSMKQLSSSALYSKSLFSFSIRKLIWFSYLIPIQRKHNGQIRIHLSINWTRVNNILIWLLFLYAVIFVYIASILPAFYILIYTLFVVAQKSHSNVPPMDMSFSPHAKLSCASVNKLRERQKKNISQIKQTSNISQMHPRKWTSYREPFSCNWIYRYRLSWNFRPTMCVCIAWKMRALEAHLHSVDRRNIYENPTRKKKYHKTYSPQLLLFDFVFSWKHSNSTVPCKSRRSCENGLTASALYRYDALDIRSYYQCPKNYLALEWTNHTKNSMSQWEKAV